MPAEIKIFHADELNREVCVVVGTRPGIVMFSPIIKYLNENRIPFFSVHTGQHYSPNMDLKFFEDLDLPKTDYRIRDVSEKKTHAGQTAAMMEGIEVILMQRKPKMILVGGDANTNLAGALAARKLHIQVGHIEAGERSYDWRMPEEHNRVIIDHISEHLFVTNEKSKKNLLTEGIRQNIYITGNPIVDASHQNYEIARRKSNILSRFKLKPSKFALMTSHREENVDHYENLKNLISGVNSAGNKIELPIVFLAHPRTLKRIKEFDLTEFVSSQKGLIVKEAVGYLDFLNMMHNAKIVFTDSGGVQQEACILKKPCITLRESTEWTETVEIGANRLAGCDPRSIEVAAMEAVLIENATWENPFGDGRTAETICTIVKGILESD
jgi:UDP-N-acetylglucosamine 2-epimerase (non-hydrolysing)